MHLVRHLRLLAFSFFPAGIGSKAKRKRGKPSRYPRCFVDNDGELRCSYDISSSTANSSTPQNSPARHELMGFGDPALLQESPDTVRAGLEGRFRSETPWTGLLHLMKPRQEAHVRGRADFGQVERNRAVPSRVARAVHGSESAPLFSSTRFRESIEPSPPALDRPAPTLANFGCTAKLPLFAKRQEK